MAVCDRELLNTTVAHEKLSIRISESFYGNTPATEDEVKEALKYAGNINLIGERSVSLAVEMGLVDKACCMMIGNVPHAQIYRL